MSWHEAQRAFFWVWLCSGFMWLMGQANGKQLASIRPHWVRIAAFILTIPAFVALWLLVRTIEYAAFLAKDVPATWQTVKNSWNGIPKVEEAEQC